MELSLLNPQVPNGIVSVLYHVSDGVVKELPSGGLVEVANHPEGHRADVAIVC